MKWLENMLHIAFGRSNSSISKVNEKLDHTRARSKTTSKSRG